ncbi:hypothetical protein STEG23_035286 [Scotinomys teguina]
MGSTLVSFPGKVYAYGEGWGSTEPLLATGAIDTTQDPGLCRAMDPDMALDSGARDINSDSGCCRVMNPDMTLCRNLGPDDTMALDNSADHSHQYVPQSSKAMDDIKATGFSPDPRASIWPLVATWASNINTDH